MKSNKYVWVFVAASLVLLFINTLNLPFIPKHDLFPIMGMVILFATAIYIMMNGKVAKIKLDIF